MMPKNELIPKLVRQYKKQPLPSLDNIVEELESLTSGQAKRFLYFPTAVNHKASGRNGSPRRRDQQDDSGHQSRHRTGARVWR